MNRNYSVETYFLSDAPNIVMQSSSLFPAGKGAELSDDGKAKLHLIRNRVAHNSIEYRCGFCGSPLRIKGDRSRCYHFEHKYQPDPKSYEDCIYYSGYLLSPEEFKRMKYKGALESAEHHRLKNFLVNKLEPFGAIHVEKMIRDDKNKHRWRKPDLRWITDQYDVAIEIQLSTTSLQTIVERGNFYSERNMFIWWIVGSKDASFTDFDILADNCNNLFVLDSEAETMSSDGLQLKCYHPEYYIDEAGHPKMQKDFVWEWAPLSEITFDRGLDENGAPKLRVFFKSEDQLISEAWERKKLAEQQKEEELQSRKVQFIEAIKSCIIDDQPLYILNEFARNDFDNTAFLREFLSSCLRDENTITKHWWNYRLTYNYLVDHQWIQAWSVFDVVEDNYTNLLPVLNLPYIPNRLLFHIITKSYTLQFTYSRDIKEVMNTIHNVLHGDLVSPDILSRYCYVLACQRIIDKNEEETYEGFRTSEQGILLLNQLHDNIDLFLVVQSFLVKRNLRDNCPNLTGMTNAVKIKKDYHPYFHLIGLAYTAGKYQNDAKLQHQIEQIHAIEQSTPQNTDLDKLFQTIFPTIFQESHQ